MQISETLTSDWSEKPTLVLMFWLLVQLFIYLFISTNSIRPSVYPSLLAPSLNHPMALSLHPSHPRFHLSIHLYVYFNLISQSLNPCLALSLHRFIYSSIQPSVHPFLLKWLWTLCLYIPPFVIPSVHQSVPLVITGPSLYQSNCTSIYSLLHPSPNLFITTFYYDLYVPFHLPSVSNIKRVSCASSLLPQQRIKILRSA